MDYNEQLFDKIEAYIRGKLTEEEAQAFEQDIAANPELQEMVQMHRFEEEGLEYLLEEDLRSKMEEWKQNPPPGPKNKGWLNGGIWGLFLLIGLSVASFFLFRNNQVSPGGPETNTPESPPELPKAQETQRPPDEPVAENESRPTDPVPTQEPNITEPTNQYLALAEETYTLPDNLSGGLKGNTTPSEESPLDKGIAAFSAQRYKQAIREFRQIRQEKDPQTYEVVREWLAHAYFRDGQYTQAAAVFQSIVDQGFMAATNDRAEWYLLLSLIPDYTNQKKQVDALLEGMLNPENYHSYAESAATLKARLDQLQ